MKSPFNKLTDKIIESSVFKIYFLLLVLGLGYCSVSYGQIDITATRGTGYYLTTVEGDTLHLSGATPYYSAYRTALSDAANYSYEYGVQVHIRSNMNERVNVNIDPEIIHDVEYIEVEKELPLYDYLYYEVRNFNSSHNRIRSTSVTYSDKVDIRYFCGDTLEHERDYKEVGVLLVDYDTYCKEDMRIEYVYSRTNENGELTTEAAHHNIPAFVLDPNWGETSNQYTFDKDMFNLSDWTQYWHGSSILGVDSMYITLEDTSSGSNVWIHNDINDVEEMEIYMRASASGGSPHIRALATPNGYAQDIYYSPGMGVIQYATWTNTSDTLAWAQNMYNLIENIDVPGGGDYVNLLIKVDTENVYIKGWFGEEPESWMYVRPLDPEYVGIRGGVGFGAHSVRLRYIDILSVGVNGAPAPR